jgi:hypothetical protein
MLGAGFQTLGGHRAVEDIEIGQEWSHPDRLRAALKEFQYAFFQTEFSSNGAECEVGWD